MFDSLTEGSKFRYGALLCGLFDAIISIRFFFLAVKYQVQMHSTIYYQIYNNSVVKNPNLLPVYLNLKFTASLVYGGCTFIVLPIFLLGVYQGRHFYVFFWMLSGILKGVLFTICLIVEIYLYHHVFELPVEWPFLDFLFLICLLIQTVAVGKFRVELEHSTKSLVREAKLCPSCI